MLYSSSYTQMCTRPIIYSVPTAGILHNIMESSIQNRPKIGLYSFTTFGTQNNYEPLKAIPLQAWTGPEVCRKSRLSDFVTMAQDAGRLSTLRTGRLYPQELHLVLISVRG